MIDIGIAAGVESMSQNDMMATVGELSPKVKIDLYKFLIINFFF